MMTLIDAFRNLVATVLPPTCVVCHDLLPASEPIGVCATCWKDLPFWNTEKIPIPLLPRSVDSFAAPFLYKNEVRKLITTMKFADRQEFAKPLAAFFNRCWPKDVEDPLIVPVPLHPNRLRKRLFNQAGFLAEEISNLKQIDISHQALVRVKKTPPQVGKKRDQRMKLQKTAFRAHKDRVKGRDIILIDDIWTTGSTCGSCAWALKKAGAKSVHALTLAYVPAEGADRIEFFLQEDEDSSKTNIAF